MGSDPDKAKIPATAVVLAGGKSRRMGEDKAALPWRGTSLGLYVARRLDGWFEEVIVSANSPGTFASSPFRTVPDAFPGAGALAGLHGGLSGSEREWIFLAACDMPFIREALVRWLWTLREGWDAVVPVRDGRMEPACAFYSRACLAPARRALEAGRRRLVSFFPDIRVLRVSKEEWGSVDPEGAGFRNINTREEYREYLEEP